MAGSQSKCKVEFKNQLFATMSEDVSLLRTKKSVGCANLLSIYETQGRIFLASSGSWWLLGILGLP